MGDAERIWQEKSDEDLLEAAAQLDDFTEAGQKIIRDELKRRGLEDPIEQGGEGPGAADDEAEEEVLDCLRCRTPLRHIDPSSELAPRWHWAGRGQPFYDPTGAIHVYACPHCGHVELFMDLPEEEEDGQDKDEGQ